MKLKNNNSNYFVKDKNNNNFINKFTNKYKNKNRNKNSYKDKKILINLLKNK